MSSATGRPTISLALPGTWIRVPMDDLDHARVDRWRRAGGDQVLVRQDTPTLLTIAWPTVLPPPAVFAGGEAAVHALGSHVGGRPQRVESRHGYPVVRERRDRPGAHSSAYWLAHPLSGRVLVIDVTCHADDREGLAVYDALAGSVAWEDADPLASRSSGDPAG